MCALQHVHMMYGCMYAVYITHMRRYVDPYVHMYVHTDLPSTLILYVCLFIICSCTHIRTHTHINCLQTCEKPCIAVNVMLYIRT